MSLFDIVVIAVIGILTIIGLWKGMVKQFVGLLGVVAGFLLAMRFYQPCSKFFTSFHPGLAKAAGFIAVFLTCILLAHLIGWALGRFLADSKLGFLNRMGGGLLGLLKGYMIISVFIVILTLFFSANNTVFRRSSTIKFFLPVTAALKKVTRGDIKAKYNEKVGIEKPARSKER
ncbi:MAG: Colicin V production protein [Syntrophorhabdus sp. PtaU1.Bin153]|nr:MAG: Colicin V production protein [Syntrophorhabdus sp. PtaU1.Bin153]